MELSQLFSNTAMRSNSQEEVVRKAHIGNRNGRPVGLCIFVSQSELRSLGIDPDENSTVLYELEPVLPGLKLKTSRERLD